jgi:molecular chaperone GrpE (heat shock protein)
MAEETDKNAALGTRRFRLPKLFAEAEDNEDYLEDEETMAAPVSPSAASSAASVGAGSMASAGQAPDSGIVGGEEILEYVAGMAQELLNMRASLETIHREVGELNSRESSQERVFNTLHAELSGYKKDFIYEHLKPVVRPLLFLYDSLEQFDAEVALHEPPEGQERRAGLSPRTVRDNVAFFRDQLVEALRVCEVTMMEMPEGPFLPKLHKAIEVVPVDESQDNTVQRVVRTGWYLNGQLLRPAEVVVGKKR